MSLNSEIETADSADFTDFEGVIGDVRTNVFVIKLQVTDNRNLLYPCNLRNLRLNPFSVFGLKLDKNSQLDLAAPKVKIKV
jgi:hypothetical protein